MQSVRLRLESEGGRGGKGGEEGGQVGGTEGCRRE